MHNAVILNFLNMSKYYWDPRSRDAKPTLVSDNIHEHWAKIQIFLSTYKHLLPNMLIWELCVNLILYTTSVGYYRPFVKLYVRDFLAEGSSSKNTYFCPSVRLSVTPFWLCSHHRIIMTFSGVTNDRSDAMQKVKVRGQRSRSQG